MCETLQVIGHSNVFAVGDATDVKETKLGYLASMEGQLVGGNMKALLAKKPLKAWQPGGPMNVSLLPNQGYAERPITWTRLGEAGEAGP